MLLNTRGKCTYTLPSETAHASPYANVTTLRPLVRHKTKLLHKIRDLRGVRLRIHIPIRTSARFKKEYSLFEDKHAFHEDLVLGVITRTHRTASI